MDPSPRDHLKKKSWIKIDGLRGRFWSAGFHQTEGIRSNITAIFAQRRTLVGIGDHAIGQSEPFVQGVIGRLQGYVEELHDPGPIEPRSRRMIVEHLLGINSTRARRDRKDVQ